MLNNYYEYLQIIGVYMVSIPKWVLVSYLTTIGVNWSTVKWMKIINIYWFITKYILAFLCENILVKGFW